VSGFARSSANRLPGDLLPVGVKFHLKRVRDGLGIGEERVDGLETLLRRGNPRGLGNPEDPVS
jgi:hypothetical protein